MKYVKFIFIKQNPAQTQLTYKLYKYEFLYLAKIENLIRPDSASQEKKKKENLWQPTLGKSQGKVAADGKLMDRLKLLNAL